MTGNPFVNEDLNRAFSHESWLVRQDACDPAWNLYYEAIFALSNGYMGVRATPEEGAEPQCRGCYLAGVFGASEEDTREMINIQNGFGLRLFVNEEPLVPRIAVEFTRILDMRRALLFRRTLFRDARGRETLVEGYRFVSRRNVHRAGIRLYVTPLNYSGRIGVESTIDATVVNTGNRPRFLVKHLRVLANEPVVAGGIYLETATADYGIAVSAAVRPAETATGHDAADFRRVYARGEEAVEYAEFAARERQTVTIDKFVCTHSSRDTKAAVLRAAATAELEAFLAAGMEPERVAHDAAWDSLWNVADVRIDGDDRADRALRFNIFHLLAVGPWHDETVSIGAKGLTGEGYIGHVFWDTEIFMVPFYTLTHPETARNLLSYRYHTLADTKRRAASEGYRGAQFPWQGTDNGFETTRKLGLLPDGVRFRRWWGEEEIHVTADVAYAVHEYVRVADDREFLRARGAEMLVETARYWVSRCAHNAALDRYEIHKVVGPDENHLHVNNNGFTNGMARWNIGAALDTLKRLRDTDSETYRGLLDRTGLTDAEIWAFENVRSKLYLPIDPLTGLVEQFDGYFQLRDVSAIRNPDGTRRYPDGVNADNAEATQLLKQADVVILLLLLDGEFDRRVQKANFDYYEKRTLHTSSLSASSHAILGLRLGDATCAYEYFLLSSENDCVRGRKEDAPLGIHLASAGGAWQSAIFGFAGLHVDGEGVLCLRPQLPAHWNRMRFRTNWRGNLLEVSTRGTQAEVRIVESKAAGIRVKVNGNPVVLSS